MKIDVGLLRPPLDAMAAIARAADGLGFDGLWTFETAHDPFLPLVIAAEHSRILSLGTSIAVAFARSPAVLAYIGWDLARFSRGRFILGLGTQVKGHNERRFGVKWEKPVQKMRETILAIRAFWRCWQDRSRLDFHGEFFDLSLMTPFFDPGPHAYGAAPIYLAGVNRFMCRLAGELCDGFHVHPLNSPSYVGQVVLPNIEAGLATSGRGREAIALSSALFVIPSDDPEESARRMREVRREIAFYASTPPYRPVFDHHGWGDAADRLRALAARGAWDAMPPVITDEMLETFATRGTWEELPEKIQRKYGGLLDRVSYYLPFTPDQNQDGWRATIAGFKRPPC
ncbi:MAG TPA: TIGR03617 family F420-dependent LLM class oxidoreductase [Candidatus Eisenbacteria bacterium]|nr:TIGR03617 family F420-dependent LLM class oxidoreductase [Candidatus Eisenbacteria bacterium]